MRRAPTIIPFQHAIPDPRLPRVLRVTLGSGDK